MNVWGRHLSPALPEPVGASPCTLTSLTLVAPRPLNLHPSVSSLQQWHHTAVGFRLAETVPLNLMALVCGACPER